MSKLTLISSPACPYGQRVAIALHEKHAEFNVISVDLDNRPGWFVAVSPLGTVPLLRIEREGEPPAVIFESASILEYIEETLPGEKLHPADPVQRAQHRGWIAFSDHVLADLHRFAMARGSAVDEVRASLVAKLRRLESEAGEGSYFAGPRFSLVDVAFAPVFRRIEALDSVSPTCLFDGLPRLEQWRRAVAARESVRAAAPENFSELYLDRLRKLHAEVLKAA
jgi:glutathione S-transferase